MGVADGSAYDYLCTNDAFESVVRAPPGRLPDGLRPSVAVCVLDFKRAAAARERGRRVLVVDSLFWMWHELPLDPAETDGYLCLEFPGVVPRVRGLNPSSRARARVIPQVLGAVGPAPATRRGGVVLNLGGGFLPLADSWHYLGILVDLVARTTGRSRPGELLTVTGSRPVVAALANRSWNPDVRIAQLSPRQMSEAVAQASLLITLPGQNTTFEGLVLATPTVLVPGLNYSQHRQVVAFLEWIESMPTYSWADLPGYGLLPAGLSEGDAGLLAMDLGARFAHDHQAQAQFFDWLAPHVATPPAPPRLAEGAPWTGFDGADHVARAALALTGWALEGEGTSL